MKTVQCDICGRTLKDLEMSFESIYHFKVTSFLARLNCEPDWDLCSDCIKALQKMQREKHKRGY